MHLVSARTSVVMETSFNLGHIVVKFYDERMTPAWEARKRGGAQPEMPDFRGFAAGDTVRGR